MKRLLTITLISLILLPSQVCSQQSRIQLSEPDGTTYRAKNIQVPNGSLTDLGNGTIGITLFDPNGIFRETDPTITDPNIKDGVIWSEIGNIPAGFADGIDNVGAPTNATYIVQTANEDLSAEQILGNLTTGLLKNTTTTGILSIAVPGTDYIASETDTIDSVAGRGASTSMTLTLSGDNILGGIKFNTIHGDKGYSGIIKVVTIDSAQTLSNYNIGTPYFVASDGELEAADADAAATMPAIGVAVETGVGSKKLLTYGLVRNSDWSWTKGGIIYASTDPNNVLHGLTQTKSSGTGDQVQIIGQCLDDPNTILVNPNLMLIEIQ